MLVLGRRLGENIRIGDDIRIVVLSVRGSQIKLGIEAPPEIPVHREEVYERILRQNRRAAGGQAETFRAAAQALRRKSDGDPSS